MSDWSCPDAELVLSVEDAKDRERWLAERRKGIGGSDLAAVMGEPKYSTAYDVWADKTGRAEEGERTIQMEMGTRMEAAVADKFAEDYRLEVRRRGMLRSKKQSCLLYNADRLVADGYGLECKFVNQFTRMPTDLSYRGGMRNDWYWQCVGGIYVTGRSGWYLAVGIGNSDFQVRSISRDDPRVQEDMQRLAEEAPRWWFDHVVADIAPAYTGDVPDLAEVAPGRKYEAMVPGAMVELRDRLREVRELKRELDAEDKDIKAKLAAEVGDAQWVLANGVPVLQFSPRAGRKSFKKANLFANAPVSGKELVEMVGSADWLNDEQGSRLIAWALEHKLTEEQFTEPGKPGSSLLIVGDADNDD